MEPSEIRKRVLQTLERAKRRAAEHRTDVEQTQRAFERLLPTAAAAWRHVASALRAEGHAYTVFSPSGSLRFASDRGSDDFIELGLDIARRPVAVTLHTRMGRGHRVLDKETILAEGADAAMVDEERVLSALLTELEPFVER